MATTRLNRVIEHLRRTAIGQDGAGLADGELLECFIKHRDEGAFEALVRRHGPMVLGVCRRILRNEADAEDAFQATFLVLVRKANSIRPSGMVSNWLFGVAQNTALKARSMIHKRRVKEREAAALPKAAAAEEVWRHVQGLLDEELGRLPDKYRVPIVVCDLEGKTIKEAARHLGWPQGTVATRLAQGRRLLAKRLSKHGLTLSGGALAALLSQGAVSAGVPVPLVLSTAKAASVLAAGQAAASGLISAKVARLIEGVMKAMFLTKLQIATVIAILAVVLGAGAIVLCRTTIAAAEPSPPLPSSPATRPSDAELFSSPDGKRIPAKPAKKKDAQKKPAAKHDFTNLQRLAKALENFNYPENAATSITVWCQGGGKGTSIQVTDQKTLDVATACDWGSQCHGEKKRLDLENVAIVSADDRSIRFVNVKQKVASGKPFGLMVNRGDLVIVLQLRKD